MNKEIIKITESDLHNIIKESVTRVINEISEGPYWQCEFEDADGKTVWKMIYAKSAPGAFKHSMEMGMRIGMEPKFETLRSATKEEIIAFKKMIRNKVKTNNTFEEGLKPEDDYVKLDNEYVNDGSLDNIDVDDEKIIDSDEEYANNYIIGRLFDAKEIITELMDYLQNSPYAIERGGDKFKMHFSKAANIFNELENFLNDE